MAHGQDRFDGPGRPGRLLVLRDPGQTRAQRIFEIEAIPAHFSKP